MISNKEKKEQVKVFFETSEHFETSESSALEALETARLSGYSFTCPLFSLSAHNGVLADNLNFKGLQHGSLVHYYVLYAKVPTENGFKGFEWAKPLRFII